MATADTTLQIWGLGHLVGVTVGVVVGGVYMGTETVAADGSVTVTYGSDTSGKVTTSYLITNFGPGTTPEGSNHDTTFLVDDGTQNVSVTVPVLVGLLYTATGQLIRPLDGGETPALGRMRRANHAAILVQEAHEDFTVGTTTAGLATVPQSSDGLQTPELALADDVPFSGVIFTPLSDAPSFDTQFAWQSAKPYRLSVALVSLFHVSGDR